MFFNKKNNYVVSICYNKKIEDIGVVAKNKKEAIRMVEEIILKCDMFSYIKNSNYKLYCKKVRKF